MGISTVGLGTNPQTLPAFVSHPCGMIASDAILFGEYPNPRTYGCFPIVLAEFVRAEKQLRLPEAIRKMTASPPSVSVCPTVASYATVLRPILSCSILRR